MAIGVEPSETGVAKATFAVIGPDIVFCTRAFDVGSIYITVADPMVTVAPVYVPWGALIIAKGCIVPIRCIISIDVLEETTLVVPLLPVSDIELMFIEKASIQSAGESPMLICTAVFALGVGVGVGFEPLELPPPPPHAVRAATTEMTTQKITK
jgi:hypothetical protein